MSKLYRGRSVAPSFACFTATVVLAAAVAPIARAATRTYDGPDGGNWTTALNWTANTVPVSSDDVILGSINAGTPNLNVTMNAVYAGGLFLNSVTLNSSALSAAMILNQSSSASEMGTQVLNIGTTTSLNTYNQSAGKTIAYTLNLGGSSAGNTYNLFGSGYFYSEHANIGVSGSGTFNQTGGTYATSSNGTGLLTMTLGVNLGGNGTFNLSNGTCDIASIQIGNGGTGTFNQSGGALTAGIQIGGFAGTGVFTQTGGTNYVNMLIASNGTYNFNAGADLSGTIDIGPGGLFNCGGGTFGSGASTFVVDGNFRLNGRTVNITNLGGASSGIVESTSGNGTLNLVGVTNIGAQDSATFAGQIRDGASGILSLSKGNANVAFVQTLSGNNTYTGSTSVTGGVLAAGSNTGFSAASAFIVNGGTLNAGGFNVTINTLGGSGGTVDVNVGSLTTNGSNASTTFAGVLAGSGSLNKSGAGQLTLNGGGSFTGTINVTAGSLRSTSVNGLPSGSTVALTGLGTSFNVNATQAISSLNGGSLTTVNMSGNPVLNVGTSNGPSAYAGGFIGLGTISKSGSGTFTLGNGALDTVASNTATGIGFDVVGGVLALDKADGTNAIGGPLVLNGGTVRLARSNQIANTSALNFVSGVLDLNGFTETVGNLTSTGGTIALNGGSLTVTQTIPSTFTTAIVGPGTFAKTGAADLTVTGAGDFIGTLAANGGKLILQGPVSVGGLVANSGGTLRFNGNSINLNAGDIRANAGGTVEYSAATIKNGFLRGVGTHTIVTGGTTTLSGVTSLNSTIVAQNGPAALKNFTNGGTFNNNAGLLSDGILNGPSGVLNVNNTISSLDLTSTGVINLNATGLISNSTGNVYLGGGSRTYVIAGGTLLTSGGTTVEINGGLLINNGAVIGTTNVNYGSLAKGTGSFGIVNVTDGGTFAPGVAAGFSTVDSASFSAGSTLAVQLGGTTQGSEYDALVASNGTSLSGTISLEVINSYVPAYGVTHHAVTAVDARTGFFSKVSGIALAPDRWLAVTYTATGVDVTAALPGDANLDGNVDFTDLVALAQQYGITTGQIWTTADFNGDGATSFADLVALAQHYNTSSALGSAQVSLVGRHFEADWALAQSLVPEPTIVSLLGLGWVVARRLRRESPARLIPQMT